MQFLLSFSHLLTWINRLLCIAAQLPSGPFKNASLEVQLPTIDSQTRGAFSSTEVLGTEFYKILQEQVMPTRSCQWLMSTTPASVTLTFVSESRKDTRSFSPREISYELMRTQGLPHT